MSGMAKTSGRIQEWLFRDEWAGLMDFIYHKHVDDACAAHGVDPKELPELLGEGGTTMLMNFLTECAFCEPVAPDSGTPGDTLDPGDVKLDDDDDLTTVIDDYLARRGYRESATAKRYLEALRDTPVSVFEVTGVNPGRNVTVRDLLMGGEPVTVNEKSGSKSLKIWDCLAARLVEINGKPMFTGSLLQLERKLADSVLGEIADLRSELKERAAQEDMTDDELDIFNPLIDAMALHGSAELVSDVWLDHILEKATGPGQIYLNTDGEEIAFCFASFEVKSGKQDKAIAALDRIEDFARADEDDGEPFWNWIGDGTADKDKDFEVPENAIIIQTTLHGSLPVRGNISIEDGIVEVTGNSKNRTEQLSKLVAANLGALVGAARFSDESILEPKGGSGEIDPEIHAEMMAQFFEDHYSKLLDESVPQLGNQSPREHVKTPQGREAVIGWLKHHENGLARQADASDQPAYDISWVWAELGIERSSV